MRFKELFQRNPEVAGLVVGLGAALLVCLYVIVLPAAKSWLTKPVPLAAQQFADSFSGKVNVVKSADKIIKQCPENDERQRCIEASILKLADTYGPVEPLQVMNELMRRKVMYGRGDYHDFVHRIGRATAKKSGLNPDAFFRCPIDYNYGCQHGFFEQALVTEPDPRKAATLVCDPGRMATLPSKFMFYCYHGVGHGIMMAAAYDLQPSLDVCDSFRGASESEGCRQGVFMEAVNQDVKTVRETKKTTHEDPLYPCNTVEKMYQKQCYMNHGGYIMTVAGSGTGSVERASKMCLKADKDMIDICMTGIGILVSNPGWQPVMVPNGKITEFYDNVLRICSHFSKGYELICLTSAVSNITNTYAINAAVSIRLCQRVKPEYQSACFYQIGSTVRMEYPEGAPLTDICAHVPRDFLQTCYRGARNEPLK